MTDQMPKPTGLSKPTVGNDDFFNQDFSKFGQPEKNLEVGGGDLAVGLAGSALRGTGTGIAEIGLSDLVRAGSALSDRLPMNAALGYVQRKLTGESEEEQVAKKADALDKITGAVTDPVDNAIIKPIVNPIGTAIKEGGETLIDRGTSDDYKEALRGRELFTGSGVSDFAIGDSAGDPAVWAAKFTDGIGSLGGTLAVGALTGGTVKNIVKRQMLKRGASMELADETARLAGIKWGQRGAIAEGVNMSTGQSADQARSQVESLSWDQLLTSKTFNDQVKEISRDPQFEGATATDLLNEARRRTADYAASIAKSDPKTWAAAAAGTLLGDAALFKMLQGTGAKGLAAGALQGMAGEGLGEAVEEGTQQYIGNEATNLAGGQNIDPMSGVVQAAATAGTIGALSGGGVGAIGGARGAHAPAADNSSPIEGDSKSEPIASEYPSFDEALASIRGFESKQPGMHAIGKDGDGFRAAYVDELGNVEVTPTYKRPEDARAAMGFPVGEGRAGSVASDQDPLSQVDIESPAFLRNGDMAGRFKGWAEDSDVQRALAGDFGPSVAEMVRQQMDQGEQGPTPSEKPLVDAMNAPLALPNKDIIFAGDANAAQSSTQLSEPGAFDDKPAGTGPQFRGAERTRWQDGQEGDVVSPDSHGNHAGALPGRVIEGEAREVGTDLPHKPFIAGQDNRAAVSEEQRRQAEKSAMAEQQLNQPKQIGQSDTIFAPGVPGADNKNSAYTPPRLSRDQVDDSLGMQSTRDPRSQMAQSIERAGSEPDSIFGQLKSLRITKRGKPFASQKEAQLASRKTETPIALPEGGFGVVDKAELEQVQASQAPVNQPSSNTGQLDQAVSQEIADGMPKQLPAPEAVRDKTRQDGLLPDDGVAPTPTNTAPASDAGVAVSGSGEKRVTIEPLTDKSIIVKGDKNDAELKDRVEAAWPKAKPLYNERHKGWVFSSKREGVVREALADLLPGDVSEQKAAPVGEVAPSADDGEQVSTPTHEQLADYGYLREHNGKWQSRSSQGGAWMTHNTRDGAIEQASKHHAYDVRKGNPVQTRQERSEQEDKAFSERMDRRHGSKTIPDLEGDLDKLSAKVENLQQAGAREFNGNGGRRTGAAVANEGARQAGQEKMDLERYIEMRKSRESAAIAPPQPKASHASKWTGTKTVADYRDGMRSLFSGEMDFGEFQAMSRHMLDNSGSIRAELEKKTKAELIGMMGAMDAAMYKGEKKDAIVTRVHRSLISNLRWAANGDKAVMTTGMTELGKASATEEERTASALAGLTEERYQQFRDKQISDRKETELRVQAIKQALSDPQTLDDFSTFIERRGIDKLTAEQRASYEDLVAAQNLDRRDAAKEVKDEAKVTPTASGDIIKTKHTKTGADLFVVQMVDRVDRDTYNTVNAKAKELGGWYSSFRGKGAIPGFQFKDETKAAAFREWLGGRNEASDTQSVDAAPTQVTEPAIADSKSKQVATLRQRAAGIRAKAESALNTDRKENTSRRAGMAANARAAAERDLNFANLLGAIADGIEAGNITYLRNLANATQLEELQGALRRALWNLPQPRRDALRSEGVITRDNDSRESWSDKATPEQQVEGAQMPGLDYYAERMRDVARKMQGAAGFKQAGAKIMALANAAVSRDSKLVTLSDPELIAKLKVFISGSDDFSTSAIKDQIAGYSRLERMGITNHTELRAALRELIRLQAAIGKPSAKVDPVTEKTRALKARLLNNRNAFIDFFPTPEEHAADMAARAGIEPGMKVLEPSAGNGMLADAARDAGATVDAVEIAADLRDILQAKGHNLVGADFMETAANGDYDAVLMNPPFSNDMDIDHVRHAYGHLKPGGRLVAIVSSMAGDRTNNKNKAFRAWLDSLGAEEEMMPEGAFKDSLNPTGVRTKIITIEKPEADTVGPTINAGNRATIYTPKGKPVQVQYRIMEAGDLVASHEFDGKVNHAYPQALQPRDRSKGTYQVQVRQIANNPEGLRLAGSPETDRGAPIVRDGIVESGNGRTIGIKQAYNNGTAGDYRAYLIEHAGEFGIDPAEVEAMQQPVLVRERMTDMDDAARRDFVVDSNTDAKMANSASEDAKADAGRLDDRLLGMLNIPEGGDLLAASNEPFLNAFARAIGENSLNQYKDDSGRWNEAYRRRVANAVFAYGYGSDALLKSATGDTSTTGKNITIALMNNAAKMAELRNAVPEHAADFVNIMAEAVDEVNEARRNGQSLQEVINQGDMLSGGVSHEGGALAEMLADASRSAKRLTETVGAIVDMLNESARNAGQVDLLTGEPATTITAQEAVNAKAREYRIGKEREQQAPRPGKDLFGLSGTRDDNSQDTGISGPAGQGQEQSSAGRLTVEGVSISIPSIDQDLQESYNSVTYRGKGPDVASGIRDEAGRILLTLKESGLLETPDQKSLAQKLVQRWADEEASNARKKMRFGVQNPSWMITGRSGRKQASNSGFDAESRREAEHHKEQSARIQRAKAALKELRSPEVIRAETFKNQWRSARAIIAEMGSYITSNRAALLAEYRKSANKTLMGHLNAMQEADPARFSAELNAQNKRLTDAGMQGLLDLVSPRSNAGKLIASVLKEDGDRVALFSLSDAAPGTRGMTKPELEMVATDWSKQYKGAASARIMVAANQAEMNEVLGMVGAAMPDGQTINAAYLPGYKTLLLNAEAIQSPKRARELMRHELLAHHGLREVVGDDAYISIIEAVKRGKDINGIKDAYYAVAENYTDMHPDVQAEEVFAHWMEKQPDRGELSIWWRGIVRRVRDALRAVGLVGERTTEEEFNRVLDAIATGMRNGRHPGRRVMESWHEAPAYSKEGALYSLSGHTPDQSIMGQAESLAKAAPSSVLNWLKEQRGVGLGTLTDLQIDQIYRGVTGGAVSRYQKLRTKMEADRNDILLDAETRIDPLWDSLGKEQKKALSNLMHDATMAKLHPDLSLADNSLYQEAKERLDKAVKPETKARYHDELNTIADNHKHLAERYSLGLNKESKALYQTMRETYDKQWADLRDAIEQRLEDMMGAEGKTLAAELRLQMEHALKHGPYFPLARFGDYVVKASKGDEHIREHFERRKDAEQAIKQYQRDGYNAVMTVKEAGNGGQANSNALGMKVMQLLDKAGESGASASAIKDDVWQAMLQMLPDASFAKHAIHRRRVKGASRDGHRAYLNSVYHYAHHVSKIRYGHKMQAELNKMNEQIQAGVRGEESNIKPEDLEVAQQVLNEMNKRHELNMNPKGAKWIGWAGNLGFMWYMAGSPASAIINMTQNFTVMLPQLGAKYGFVKASAAMAKALHDYAKHGKFKAGTKEAWVSLTRADSGITRDEKALLNSLYKAGALDLTQAHSVAARADTDLQDVKPGAAWKRKTMAWLGSMFHNAEVLNREVAALAAYRLLKSADPSLSPEQYADKVTEMVYDGHGNYAASNRPRYMRGDVAKVLTQFKIYSQMMTYTLYRNAYLAAKGDKVALKTLGGVLGTHFIMAGVMGLPFPITAALYAIAAAADDDDDRTGEASFRLGLAETLGTDLGELVARGPMDAVTGLSIAGRTGINDLWFREPKEGAEGDDLAWHVTQQIAGPVLGIGVQAARGLSMMSDGDYQRGAEAMMPKALKDLAKSYRQASDGEQTRKGDVIIDDVSAFNVAMQAMGFGNAEMAKAYDAREYIKGKEGRIEDERSKLMSDYFMARKDGDDEAMADVMARIREFNSNHYRTEAITSRTLRQSLKSKQRSAHRTQGGVYLSRNREYLRGEGAFIGDGGTATN